MISDAVHSASDVFSTIVVLIGIRLASKKPDKEHPYGHERLECVTAIILSVVLFITGLGIASAIFALALQDAVKDIIAGVNIIVDEYFIVGDVIKIGDVEGKIIELGLKSTKVRDINNGNLLTVANRNISEALIEPDYFFIKIPLSYSEKIEKVEAVIGQIMEKIKAVEDVKDVEYKGLSSFEDSSISYTLKIFTKAEVKPIVKCKSNRIIKLELDKNNMEIPYTQIDVHNR